MMLTTLGEIFPNWQIEYMLFFMDRSLVREEEWQGILCDRTVL
jgi:hypothetical protein